MKKNRNIYAMNYEEVKLFDCGSRLHKRFPHQQKMKVNKPLLTEVFENIEKLCCCSFGKIIL